MKKTNLNNVLPALGFILLCNAAGAIGALFTANAIPTWYQTLIKPSWNPPSFVFGPVWTTLYCLMGYAVFLVWKQKTNLPHKRIALSVFFLQLVLNALWSILFFGLRSPALAFVEILLLWAAIAITTLHFSRLSKTAAALLVPYLCWVTFASVLNFVIWRLNA